MYCGRERNPNRSTCRVSGFKKRIFYFLFLKIWSTFWAEAPSAWSPIKMRSYQHGFPHKLEEPSWLLLQDVNFVNTESWMRTVVIGVATTSFQNSLGWLHPTVTQTEARKRKKKQHAAAVNTFLVKCLYSCCLKHTAFFTLSLRNSKNLSFCL